MDLAVLVAEPRDADAIDRHRVHRARRIARQRRDLVERIVGELARIERVQVRVVVDDETSSTS
ncbi:MAG: hypothetical protein IPL61_20115 [Myxococcales bacterium]|nr:hypothetical protein [Myxococcales bacterium]